MSSTLYPLEPRAGLLSAYSPPLLNLIFRSVRYGTMEAINKTCLVRQMITYNQVGKYLGRSLWKPLIFHALGY